MVARAAWSKASRNESPRGATRASASWSQREIIEIVIASIRARFGPQAIALGDGESDIPNPTFGSGSGSVQDLSARRQKGHQLSFLCVCGKKPIELKTLGCCRRCYDRGYTLRGFSVVCESGCWSAIASAAGRVARGHVCWFIIATGATNRISSSLYVSAAISGYIAPWA
jgi:hypothetical protein